MKSAYWACEGVTSRIWPSPRVPRSYSGVPRATLAVSTPKSQNGRSHAPLLCRKSRRDGSDPDSSKTTLGPGGFAKPAGVATSGSPQLAKKGDKRPTGKGVGVSKTTTWSLESGAAVRRGRWVGKENVGGHFEQHRLRRAAVNVSHRTHVCYTAPVLLQSKGTLERLSSRGRSRHESAAPL